MAVAAPPPGVPDGIDGYDGQGSTGQVCPVQFPIDPAKAVEQIFNIRLCGRVRLLPSGSLFGAQLAVLSWVPSSTAPKLTCKRKFDVRLKALA